MPPNIITVLPICRPDFHLAMKWLAWARRLDAPDGEYPNEPLEEDRLVVYVAQSVEAPLISKLREAVHGWDGVKIYFNPEHYEHPELGYGAMANQMFRSALEMTERIYPGRATLWCEPDCIPICPRWIEQINAEYHQCKKPFMGDFHAPGQIPHMTGNAVYAANWRELAPSFADLPGPVEKQGWDSQCAHQTVPQSHRSCRIQQTWIVPMPRFTVEALKMLHPETVLFHRCKDGSLIDALCQRAHLPRIPLGPPVCHPTPANGRAPVQVRGGGTAILIVSFARDIEMVDYLLKSIRKYCRGFAGTTIAVPVGDARAFGKFERNDVTITTFFEPVGKGMLMHEVMKCRADELCPGADRILHVDSDCIFWRPTSPDDFISKGKCRMIREHYELIAPRNPNRLIWATCVERATGIVPTHDVMVAHPNIYPAELYRHVRDVVECHTEMEFNEYVLSCENGFPQGFAEFPTIGSVGLRDMPEMFDVLDYNHEVDSLDCGIPGRGHQYIYRPERDAIAEGWSHGGLGRYKADWDRFLRGETPKYYLK